MNYKLKQPDFDKLPKETNLMEALNTQWRQAYVRNE